MNPEIKEKKSIHELVDGREIERKFHMEPHTTEALLGVFAHRAVRIEQHYLDEFDSDYELRVRNIDDERFSACLKSKAELERLELEVPISKEAYIAHSKRSLASVTKKRVELGEGSCLDVFEGAYGGVLEVEFPDKQTAQHVEVKDKPPYREIRLVESRQIKSSREVAEKNRMPLDAARLPARGLSEYILGKIALEKPPEKQPYVIGIAGPSASGKTSFIRSLQEVFGYGNVSSLCLDNYIPGKRYLEKEHGVVNWSNWDLPEVYDTSRVRKDLRTLLQGETIEMPIFDFERAEPKSDHFSETVKPAPVLVVEGLYALDENLLPMLDRTLYIDGPIEQRMVRRIERDVSRCGWKPDEIFAYMMEHAEPTRYEHIEPQKDQAEFVISS